MTQTCNQTCNHACTTEGEVAAVERRNKIQARGCIGPLSSYLRSWIKCWYDPPTTSPATTNASTERLVRENTYPSPNVVQRRPASDTTANLSSSTRPLRSPTSENPLVPDAPSKDSTKHNVISGLLEPPKECCEKKFTRPHLYDFHQESHTVSVSSPAASRASSDTFVQKHQEQLPQSLTPDVIQQSKTLFAKVQYVLWIDHVKATRQGVYGMGVLVSTFYDTVQLMEIVDFRELLQERGDVEGIMAILVNKRARSLGSLSSVFLIELNEPSGKACSVS